VSKYDFDRVVANVEYKIQGEVLPSGKVVFTFGYPLPGRTKVVSVDEDIVMDIVKDSVVNVEYDHKDGAVVLSLETLTEVKQNVENGDLMVGYQHVADEDVLDIILDFVVTPCDNCGGFHFGDDILPEPAKALPPAPAKKKPPTYLN
jgi:hypothetical protein